MDKILLNIPYLCFKFIILLFSSLEKTVSLENWIRIKVKIMPVIMKKNNEFLEIYNQKIFNWG